VRVCYPDIVQKSAPSYGGFASRACGLLLQISAKAPRARARVLSSSICFYRVIVSNFVYPPPPVSRPFACGYGAVCCWRILSDLMPPAGGATMPARGLCRPVQRLLPGEGAYTMPIKIKPLRGLCARSRLRFGFAPLIPSLIPSSIKRKGCRGCTLCRDMCLWLALLCLLRLLRLLRLFSTICRPLHPLAFVVLKPFHFIIKRVKHCRAVA